MFAPAFYSSEYFADEYFAIGSPADVTWNAGEDIDGVDFAVSGYDPELHINVAVGSPHGSQILSELGLSDETALGFTPVTWPTHTVPPSVYARYAQNTTALGFVSATWPDTIR